MFESIFESVFQEQFSKREKNMSYMNNLWEKEDIDAILCNVRPDNFALVLWVELIEKEEKTDTNISSESYTVKCPRIHYKTKEIIVVMFL